MSPGTKYVSVPLCLPQMSFLFDELLCLIIETGPSHRRESFPGIFSCLKACREASVRFKERSLGGGMWGSQAERVPSGGSGGRSQELRSRFSSREVVHQLPGQCLFGSSRELEEGLEVWVTPQGMRTVGRTAFRDTSIQTPLKY